MPGEAVRKIRPISNIIRILVKAGDTLHSLAEEYNEPSVSSDREYVSEIRKLNHMKSSGLIPGQSLIITYYDTEYK